jgi:hypothetical protein
MSPILPKIQLSSMHLDLPSESSLHFHPPSARFVRLHALLCLLGPDASTLRRFYAELEPVRAHSASTPMRSLSRRLEELTYSMHKA